MVSRFLFGFAFVSKPALVILKVLKCADIRSERSFGIKRRMS